MSRADPGYTDENKLCTPIVGPLVLSRQRVRLREGGGRNLLPNRPILGTSKVAVAEESPAESTHTASENEKRKSD